MDHTIAPGMPAKKPPQTAFGKRMVALRQARGLTQIELAKAAETTQRAISYYETEAEFPIASALIPLARALRVTTDELLGVKPAKLDQGSRGVGVFGKDFSAWRHCPNGISARSSA